MSTTLCWQCNAQYPIVDPGCIVCGAHNANTVEPMMSAAEHKAACETILRATRLLRMHGQHAASNLLIEHVTELTEVA